MGNIVLSNDISIPVMDCDNRNVVIVGASGCGKTCSVIEPTILGFDGSMIIIDPKGAILKKCGNAMRGKYRIRSIDLVEPTKSSSGFNPFNQLNCDSDVISLAHMIVYSSPEVKGDNVRMDPFWNQQAKELLCIMIDYELWRSKVKRKKPNMYAIQEFMMKLDPNDENGFGFIRDINELPEKGFPGSLCRKMFKKFWHVNRADKTMACIISSLEGIIGRWCNYEMEQFFDIPDIQINTLMVKPTALFIRISDTDESLYSLAALMISNYIDQLCKQADAQKSGKSKIPIQIILDDYATHITIENMPRYISILRARNIGIMLVIQSLSQLEHMHGKAAKTITNNCEYAVYFSSMDIYTAEDLSKRLNIPLCEALAFSKDKVAVFKRGENPTVSSRFDLSKLYDIELNQEGRI